MKFYKSNRIRYIIIVVQNKTVVPDYKRKPTDDVVLYVPLENDIAEKTGKNTITNYSVSLSTAGGITAGYFNGNARIETSQHQFSNTSHTLSARVYYPASGYTGTASFISANPCGIFNGDTLSVSNSGTEAGYISYYSSNRSRTINKSGLNLKGSWHLITFSGGVLYVDGQQVGSGSGSYAGNQIYTIGGHTTNSSCTRGFMTGYLREVIIGNSVRDAATVLAYYNKTKKYFGL